MIYRCLLVCVFLTNLSMSFSQSITSSKNESVNATSTTIASTKLEHDVIIDLENINRMAPLEYLGKRIVYMWNELGTEEKEGNTESFIGRCIGVAKKIKQLLPFLMFGGGVVITKLGFLLLFSLKTIGLLMLLLMINLATTAAKIGALFAHKKSDQAPQNIHFHVKGEEHHSDHITPYGWDDRKDSFEGHELYNMYEKLKRENELLKYYHSR